MDKKEFDVTGFDMESILSQKIGLQEINSMTNPESSTGVDLDRNASEIPHSVLIVDDDSDTVDLIKTILMKAGFNVASASDCESALTRCMEVCPDIILLDLMMPRVDGFDTYQKLKYITQAPVIMITANPSHENAVKGINCGMDDYIFKPFFNNEMIARVRSSIRRSKEIKHSTSQEFLDISLSINFDSRQVFLRDQPVPLTSREYITFSTLAAQADKPVKYAYLTEKLWGSDSAKHRAHLKTIIFSVRKKLEDQPEKPRLIVNYRSIGYMLVTNSRFDQ